MRILCLADEESKLFWDYFRKDYFEDIDLIISCGDLNSSYLTFIETMTSIPLLYVRGNHDDSYRDKAPEGCVCIEDKIVKLIHKCNNRGGLDNISIAYMDFREGDEK